MEKKQKFIELQLPVPWGHISAKSWGSPTNKKILAVHGLMDNAGTFDRVIALLPKDYYIVCIDLPGHGFSSHFGPGVPLNFFSYVITIHHVLSALKWDTCIYMGHSFGGHIGTMFSILYPKRLEKLILLDSMLSIPMFNDELISHLRSTCDVSIKANTDNTSRTYTKEEVLHALAYKRFSTLNAEATEALFNRAVTKVNERYKYNRDFRLSAQISPFLDMDQLITCLKELSTPCLVIAASSTLEIYVNHLMPHIIDKVNQLYGFVTVVRVVGNHDVHNNNPEKVAPHICEFLNNNVKSKL